MDKDKIEYIDWEQLARYINDESTEEDRSEVNEWLSADKENRELFESLRDKWDKTGTMNKEQYNVDKAWNKLSIRISEGKKEEPRERPSFILRENTSKLRFLNTSLIRVAVVVVIMLGIAYLLTNRLANGVFLPGRTLSYLAAPDSEQSFQLPDGSQVFLNAASQLDYRVNKKADTREAYLRGEAFFDVKPDSNKAFIVHAGKAIIKVIGTSFNIRTSEEGQKVEVYVESGRVELAGTGRGSSSMVIEPGFSGQLADGTITRHRTEDDNLLSWKTKELVFREMKLDEVVKILNGTFHTNIQFKQESIASFRFTGNFNDQPIDTVLKVLCTAFNLSYDSRETSIILTMEE